MKPIYKNKSYKFTITITVNGSIVDISNDQVIAYVNNTYGDDTPSITAEADLSEGTLGKANIEFDKTQTNLNPGSYFIQVVWKLASSTREFVVFDDLVTVKLTIK